MTREELAEMLTLYKRLHVFARRMGMLILSVGLVNTLLLWGEPPYSALAWPPSWPLLYTLSGVSFCLSLMSFSGAQVERYLR